MNVLAVVQARYGSSRLRGKAMLPLAGRPMLEHVLRRAMAVPGVGHVVLATSLAEFDRQLTWVADDVGVESYRGDEHDVLGRLAHLVDVYQPDAVMRLTGDCPLLAPDVCARVLETYQTVKHNGYVTNDVNLSGYPDGTDCELVRTSVLRQAAQHASSAGDREHVTSWIRRHYQQVVAMCAGPTVDAKLSVDRREDFERVRRVYGCLQSDDGLSFVATVAAYRRAFPEDV